MNVFYNPFRRHQSTRHALTREQLRQLARKHGVRRGRNTDDTLNNLRAAGIAV